MKTMQWIKNFLARRQKPITVEQVLAAVEFSSQAGLERCLGLPQRYLSDKKNLKLPETQALFKILVHFPWMIYVVDAKFDRKMADLYLKREAINIQIAQRHREV